MPVANRSRWRSAIELASAVLLVAVVVSIYRSLALQAADDDQFFLHALDQRTLADFLSMRYREWSGRTLIEGLLVTTIGFPIVWKAGIPLAFVGSAWCIWRLALSARLPAISGTLAVTVLMLLIHKMVLQDTAFWVTGFYNYLLPCFFGLLAAVVLSDRVPHAGRLYLLAVPAAIIACQSEQMAFVLLASLFARMLHQRLSGQRSGAEGVILLAGGLSALASVLAPGNEYRLTMELRWLPEYAGMGLAEKLALGLDRISAHVQSPRNVLMVIVAGVSAWATLRMERSAPARVSAVILLLFVASAFATILIRVADLDGVLPRITGISEHLSPAEWSRFGIFASLGFTIAVYGALLTAAACRARDAWSLLVGVGVPAMAFGATMLVALSPTIYASGFRILFIGDMLLVLHASLLLADLIGNRRFIRNTMPGDAHA